MVDRKLESLGLANKNGEHPVKFKFQINNRLIFSIKYIPCDTWDIVKLCCFSETQIERYPVFYLATRLKQRPEVLPFFLLRSEGYSVRCEGF